MNRWSHVTENVRVTLVNSLFTVLTCAWNGKIQHNTSMVKDCDVYHLRIARKLWPLMVLGNVDRVLHWSKTVLQFRLKDTCKAACSALYLEIVLTHGHIREIAVLPITWDICKGQGTLSQCLVSSFASSQWVYGTTLRKSYASTVSLRIRCTKFIEIQRQIIREHTILLYWLSNVPATFWLSNG